MEYTLQPAEKFEGELFRSLEGIAVKIFGAIGILEAEFKNGGEFWELWHDDQPSLKTAAFDAEFDNVLAGLRAGGKFPPFADRENLTLECMLRPGLVLPRSGFGYKIHTPDFSFYFNYMCPLFPCDIICSAFDNRQLMPALEILRGLEES